MQALLITARPLGVWHRTHACRTQPNKCSVRKRCMQSAAPGAAGSTADIPWRDVRVGQVLRVDDEELFPADLLCLYSALPDNACFIKTTNLDGESNLKIRRPVDLREAAPEEESDVMHIRVRACT